MDKAMDPRTLALEIVELVGDLVATRPNGYPAGELWAAIMEWCPKLDTFETMMRVTEKVGLVEKKGDLYYATGRQKSGEHVGLI